MTNAGRPSNFTDFTLDQFRSLLLDIWREACRHIEIQEATGNIAVMLARQLPVGAVIVRRLKPHPAGVATVAQVGLKGDPLPLPESSPLSPTSWKQIQAWGKQFQVTARPRGTRPRQFKPIVADELSEEMLLGPLTSGANVTGVLMLVAAPGMKFDATHRRVTELLLEPFSAALDNDHRLHELAALREAAEADKASLLTKLGRTAIKDEIVGADSGLKPVMERAALVAPSDVPVLILGETGTGKEVISRAIHNRSSRATGPFIRVNCGAIPTELIDSQLFGHEKGSFTGASEQRQGWFERADGGTLFLDEIGELPLQAQVRLLRVLQDGSLERVGGQNPLHVDVRIVAATHRDLTLMVQAKEFREDLWYRLAVFPIVLPPLRERKADIAELARHFAERAATRFGLHPSMPTDADIILLTDYDWPGNIRELGTVIDRAAILGEGKLLDVSTALGVIPPKSRSISLAATTTPGATTATSEITSLDEAIRQHISIALQATQGRIEGPKGAAKLLHINPHTLRAKMRKLKLEWAQYRE